MHLRYRQTCRVCGNSHLADVIDLGDQYLQGSFVKAGTTEPSSRKIPTKLVRCDVSKSETACGLVQMSVTTPPRILYANYWYASGISQTMRSHLEGIVEEVSKLMGGYPTGTPRRVLDIACNDGTLLSYYGSRPQVERYGVDPSDIARKATAKAEDAIIINDLFPTDQLVVTTNISTRTPPTPGLESTQPIKFDAITSIAVYYDLEDPVAFAKAIASHLKDSGMWVLEVAYLPATLKQVSYDTIVGEHLEYYSLASLEAIMERAGLRIFRADLNASNGGSIRAFVCKATCRAFDTPKSATDLAKLRMTEFDLALDTDAPYEQFRARVATQRADLKALIEGIVKDGGRVHLLGASTKANTLLQACGLDSRLIPYASERSPEKHGARTLGTDIQIVSETESRALKPTHYLIGPWHFRDEILQRERDTVNRDGIKLIVPLPVIEVIDRVA